MAESTKGKKKIAVFASIGLLIASKFKTIIGLLKFSKFGATLLSLFVSLGGYAMFYGWKFAVALVYLIFVHEMGHLIAARQKGIKTSPAVFIPFVGAMISMKDQPRSAQTEAYIAYGGPLLGTVAFLPAVLLYPFTEDPFLALIITLGAFINLFNLFPVSPLDGGRIVTVLSTKIWFFGLIALIPLLFIMNSPLLILIFIFGLFTWWRHVREGYEKKVLAYQMKKHKSLINDLQYVAGELHLIEQDDATNRIYRINAFRYELEEKLRWQLSAIERKEQKEKTFFIPILQDDERLKRDKQKLDHYFTNKKKQLYHNMTLEHDAVKEQIEKEKASYNEEKERFEELASYYEAPAKIKWLVLSLYIGLAAILGFFLWYGMTMIQKTPLG